MYLLTALITFGQPLCNKFDSGFFMIVTDTFNNSFAFTVFLHFHRIAVHIVWISM